MFNIGDKVLVNEHARYRKGDTATIIQVYNDSIRVVFGDGDKADETIYNPRKLTKISKYKTTREKRMHNGTKEMR